MTTPPADTSIPTAPGPVTAAAAGLTPQQWWEVTSPPVDLANATAELLPATGTLDARELEQLVATIVARTDLWEPLVVVDAERRRYRLLYEDDRIDIWVLSWMPGQGTGFHDHDMSAVGLACATGEVVERQMLLPHGATSISMTPGVTRPGPPGYIHAVRHEGGDPAVTIHAYSPPLVRVGQYRVDDAGVLCRDIMHGRQELLDNTIAQLDPDRA